MKVLPVFVVCLTIASAEPSVPITQYVLTPSPQYGIPSTQYGVPNDNHIITLVPTEQYETPNLQHNLQIGVPQSQYGVQTISNSDGYFATGPKPNSQQQYGIQTISNNDGYFGTGPKPNSQYGVPQISKNQFVSSDGHNTKLKHAATSTVNNIYSTSSSTKTKPQYDLHNTYFEGKTLDKYEGNDEPASYHFRYYVQDSEGTDFGHEENRQGDVANGRYHVLLPDGKRQNVEYTADAEGYKPKISYEQVGAGYEVEEGNLKQKGYLH